MHLPLRGSVVAIARHIGAKENIAEQDLAAAGG
jgi:hypothetical protein